MLKTAVRTLKNAPIFLFKANILVASVFLFMLTLFSSYKEASFPGRGNFVLAFLYASILITIATMYECFKIGEIRLKELIFSFCISIFITNFLTYLILSLIAEKVLDPLALIVLTLIQIIISTIFYIVSNKLYFILYPSSPAVFVSSYTEYEKTVLSKFNKRHGRIRIESVCYETDSFEEILKSVNKYSTLVIGNIDNELKTFLLKYCFEKNKTMYILPTVQDIVLNAATERQIDDTLMFYSKSRSISIEQLAIKRLMDIAISFFGLLFASPIMLIVALIIKLTDKGPVFFKQERYTRNEKVFTVIKFRSMVVDAEKDGAQFTVNNDQRITPIGKFIRATRLDELPQLINILKGDMSFVGPRAERIENVEAYSEVMPDFRYRMKVKAGLTGYAQIFGKYNTSCEDKARMDMLYIQNYSIFLDLKIIFYTIKIIFMKESTDGFESNK